MSYSLERVYHVLMTPTKMLVRSEDRFSWDITNIGAQPVFYMRGVRGRDMAITGENQGVPIAANATDGYDEEDAIDEVWVICSVAQDIMVHQTMVPGLRLERVGGRHRAVGRRR